MKTIQRVRPDFRILAIDARPRRIGYVCLDKGQKLLAARAARFTSMRAADARLAAIVNEIHPTVPLLRRIRRGSWRDWPGARMVQRSARTQARRASASVVYVSEGQLARFYRAYGLHNKHELATFLVQVHPELAFYQPQQRKAWEPEHRYMLIFDAAALALVHIASSK